jgi:hypothetical protein
MDEPLRSPWLNDRNDGAPGCAYIIEEGEDRRCCGEGLRPGSSYCPPHHALCHLACGTIEEARILREVEALARAVGGRRAADGGGPSRRFLRRLEQAARAFS